jgi:hypothetical protein
VAKGFTIEFKGIKDTIAKLEDKGDDIKKQVDFAIGINTDAMASEAKQRAPYKYSRLRSSISANKIKDYLYELVAQVDYAAYVEFGTGNFAASYVPSLDNEWQILAKEFYVNGQGRTPQNPYLYPAYKRILPILYKDLEQITNENERL